MNTYLLAFLALRVLLFTILLSAVSSCVQHKLNAYQESAKANMVGKYSHRRCTDNYIIKQYMPRHDSVGVPYVN